MRNLFLEYFSKIGIKPVLLQSLVGLIIFFRALGKKNNERVLGKSFKKTKNQKWGFSFQKKNVFVWKGFMLKHFPWSDKFYGVLAQISQIWSAYKPLRSQPLSTLCHSSAFEASGSISRTRHGHYKPVNPL